MFITAKTELVVLQVVEEGEGDTKKSVVRPGGVFPAGCHAVDRIFNPVTSNGPRWLVLRGTKVGHAEVIWKRWTDPVRGDRAVVITEERPAPSASATDDGPATLPASEDSFTSGPGESERGPHPDAVPPAE